MKSGEKRAEHQLTMNFNVCVCIHTNAITWIKGEGELKKRKRDGYILLYELWDDKESEENEEKKNDYQTQATMGRDRPK